MFHLSTIGTPEAQNALISAMDDAEERCIRSVVLLHEICYTVGQMGYTEKAHGFLLSVL